MNTALWRRVAGIAILALLVAVFVALVPPYYRNWEFRRHLDDLVQQPPAFEQVQAAVVRLAADSGLPVRTGDVHVERSGKGVRVEIIYVVRVDLPLYTVDLHFHPTARTE